MSSLVHLPSGATFDCWWEEMRGRAGRKRFLLTKILEVIAYKASKKGRAASSQHQPKSVLKLPPHILRNGVNQRSRAVVISPAKCRSESQFNLLQRWIKKLTTQTTAIIVINDGSAFWSRLPEPVHVLTNAISNPKNSRRKL